MTGGLSLRLIPRQPDNAPSGENWVLTDSFHISVIEVVRIEPTISEMKCHCSDNCTTKVGGAISTPMCLACWQVKLWVSGSINRSPQEYYIAYIIIASVSIVLSRLISSEYTFRIHLPERGAEIIALTMRLIWQYQPLQAVDMFISTSWTSWYVHINLINKLIRLINTYRPLKRISPLIWDRRWMSPGRERDISRNSARHYRSFGVREHAGKP
jgi:hypothetical protein